MAASGKYEPKDSRNVTGTASTEDGRWTNRDRLPPLANGEHEEPRSYEDEEQEDEEQEEDPMMIAFQPDPELERMIETGRRRRSLDRGEGQTRH
jgi:hypothetical protein